ncbi:INO80 complex subunit E-like [Ptychodera flava]|uniref:INO80 complex subunit E-like n=1 Tax=Ptychodera flava TaxID=63121 RepID=UPI003969FF1E
MMPVADEFNSDVVDAPNYKQKYKTLKRKLKYLVYEQECFNEELKKAQRKLLKVSRDKSFLLDRLLQYEQIEDSSSDSDDTDSSSSDNDVKDVTTQKSKKKKTLSHPLPSLPYGLEGFNPQMLGAMGYPGLLPSTSSQATAHLHNPMFSDIPPKKPKKSRSAKAGSSSKSSSGSKKSDSKTNTASASSAVPVPDTSPKQKTVGEEDESVPPPEDMYEGDDNLIIDIPE